MATTTASAAEPHFSSKVCFSYLLEKAQTLDETYALVEGASDVFCRYPALATKAGETYQLAKTLVPEDYHETVESYEKGICALDKAALASHALTLDSAIQDRTVQLMQAARETKQQVVNNVVSAASERAIFAANVVDSGIDILDSTVDYMLPERTAVAIETRTRQFDMPEKPQPNSAQPSEHVQYIAQKAMRTSKKAQKRAFDGLQNLRLRSQTIGTVDLIQYNRFLDIGTLREAISKDAQQLVEGARDFGGALVTDAIGKATKVYEVVEGEIVVAVKPVWQKLEGKAGNSVAKINAVAQPAREFYTTVVAEFLNNPAQAAKEFIANVEVAIGPEWTKALEEPTIELWGTMKAIYALAPGDVETLIANVGKCLNDAWAEKSESLDGATSSPLVQS